MTSGDLVPRIEALLALSRRQLFFVGGAPRSGTTWLQEILDVHPAISCGGEALFPQALAAPIDALIAAQAEAIAGKSAGIFSHRAAYPTPGVEDADVLLAVGILLALERQRAGRDVQAIGEKTPENVFLFPRLKRLFPRAKFIAIARDPRDVLTSAWHFFPRPESLNTDAAKAAFVEMALPSMVEGTRAILDFGRHHSVDLLVVTYEALKAKPEVAIKRLYGFLGVDDADTIVADTVARTSFEAMKKAGTAGDRPFLRKGLVGDWRGTLTPALGDRVVSQLEWAFDTFKWSRC